MVETLEFNVSCDSPDREWDNFLLQIAGSHHVQTSLWALVNAFLGWKTVRVIARQNKRIMAGAQVLFKPLSDIMAIGYVPKGPVFSDDDPTLWEALFRELSAVAETNKILFLLIQPPKNATVWLNQLSIFGFQPSKVKMGPTATILLDLNLDLDTILSQMKTRTRYNINLSFRKGLQVRKGTEKDLDTYYELFKVTSGRQQFRSIPKQYFEKMWEVLKPYGYIELFLAEYKKDVISAQLVVPFGNAVVNKLSVWSGRYANLKPNEALQWFAVCWSKGNGFRYYDLEGIDSQLAVAILHDEPVPETSKQSLSSFKLGFGGQIVLLPGVYDYIYKQEMRVLYDNALMNFASSFESMILN